MRRRRAGLARLGHFDGAKIKACLITAGSSLFGAGAGAQWSRFEFGAIFIKSKFDQVDSKSLQVPRLFLYNYDVRQAFFADAGLTQGFCNSRFGPNSKIFALTQ